MRKVVILQPLFFPWVGVFEQIKLGDVFIHYDDVQFPLGKTLVNRIQIKTKDGSKWLTVPVQKRHHHTAINKARIDRTLDWQRKHTLFLKQNYASAPYRQDMLEIVDAVYRESFDCVADLNIFAIELVSRYFNLYESQEFYRSSELKVPGSGTQRLVDIVEHCNGDIYITGMGALNYLDHDVFEKHGIRVEYMNYERRPYTQTYGQFDPHVSILDLIANMGCEGATYIGSSSRYFKDFLQER